MKAVDTIFLDLDGPLLDGRRRHYSCYERILNACGFVPVDEDTYWHSKREMINRRDLLELSSATKIYDKFLSDWLAVIESPEALALDVVQPGAIDCLKTWKQQGKRLVLVTLRKDAASLTDQLKSNGLSDYLDHVLVCTHESGGQGKAQAVRVLIGEPLNELRAIWVGDTEVDAQAAEALGIEVFLVANGLRSPRVLEGLHSAGVIESIVSLKKHIS